MKYLPVLAAVALSAIACTSNEAPVPQVRENSLESLGLSGKVQKVETQSYRFEDGEYIQFYNLSEDGSKTFNEDGLLIEDDGRGRMVFEYDQDQKLLSREVYNGQGLVFKSRFERDELGRVVKETASSDKGVALFTFEYGEDGNAIETETNFDGDTTVVTFMVLDELYRTVSFSRDFFATEYHQSGSYEYWPDGRIRKQTFADEMEGVGTETIVDEYDETGRELGQTHSFTGEGEDQHSSMRYEYENDAQGNWIVKYVFIDDSEEPVGKIARTITYFGNAVSE